MTMDIYDQKIAALLKLHNLSNTSPERFVGALTGQPTVKQMVGIYYCMISNTTVNVRECVKACRRANQLLPATSQCK